MNRKFSIFNFQFSIFNFFNRFVCVVSSWLLIILCILCGELLLHSFPSAVEASKKGAEERLTKKIKKKKSTLERLKKDIELQKKRLEAIQKEEDSIYTRLDIINRRIRISKKELSLSKADLKENRTKKKEIGKKLRTIRSQLKKTKKVLALNMRELYKRGRSSTVKILLSAGDFSDFLRGIKYSRKLAASDADVIERKKKQEKELKDTKKALQETEEKITLLIAGISRKKDQAVKEKGEKKALLKDITLKKEVYLQHKRESEQAAERLLTLLERLEERRKKAAVEEKMKPGNFYARRGTLPWPVQGKVISSFGKIKNRKFNVYTYNNGIEIASRADKEIHAVHGGEIIFSDWFKGYGKLVILDNGGGYYTLYGHLNEIEAEVGRHVGMGEVIGKAGETDSIRGTTLYFEIREKGRPVNPLKWLSPGKI